ncbi:alginate lyase [Flavobacterium sp. LMO8]|jgi:poly(beta-D-mannuronate) lyase|uniref:polysaccharide lyase 6 family protein n=1 Tax=Flavobacterium sp. LMO8 TaxID=2654244 RepID=UPI001292842E|nr:polysaccharide lyase 6 family protein [Flavobacterium sp. LMO8]MQP24427.1 alginate lyase [Flavobacterium sp. LMO8]
MKIFRNFLLFTLTITFIVVSCKSTNNLSNTVKNVAEFNQAVTNAKPGTTITLANGVWENSELVFTGKGTKENPITLTVQDKGQVVLSGLSNLRVSGEYLVVKGLVFKNGYTPTSEVISFRTSSDKLANNCRLTECVIDNYSNPERHESDYWIGIYGKNNRIDHNHIEGKTNLGVTMAVRLNSVESQENNHQIDHNYFGPRPNLGANGGETLRIGTSHYSLTNSKTIVEYNYFDRCNGEHEIISNKSCQNTYRYNTFFECTGTLTMRHGSQTLVDGNVFIGNGKPSTGGIRVINGQQTVINNYCIGLTGYRFRGAFVIMNGVPNSTINRYHQAKDAVVENNTFINCDNIQLCAGSDDERSAIPENCKVDNNIFYHDKMDKLFTIYDDISGISFNDNFISPNVITGIPKGFSKVNFTLTKDKNGLLIPDAPELKKKVSINPNIASKENTGASWYPKKDKIVAFRSGKTIKVDATENSLFDAVANSNPGDVIELISSGNYLTTKTIDVNHTISIVSYLEKKPTLFFEKSSMFDILNGGKLELEGLHFDGEEAPDYAGNAVIRTSKYSMNHNYSLLINYCEFDNLDVNHTFDVLQVYKNTFADTISITNSKFKTVSGNIMLLDKETDDKGIYNAEYVILKNNTFTDVQGAILDLYRGGTDESTFGPFLEMNHNVLDNVGNGKRNKTNSSINLYGVQVNEIQNNIINKSKGFKMYLVVGEPIVNLFNNNFYLSDKYIITGDEKFNEKNTMTLNPEFQDNSYLLKASSPLVGKGTDGKNLGILSK